jgi:heme A synthase
MINASERAGGSRPYRAGVAVAVLATLGIVWTTIVRDDGNGIGFFMLIMAAVVGGFAASFRPAGMARTMLGVAIMQVLLGMLVVTAPSTASVPDGGSRIILACCAFAALWLISAALFLAAAKGDREHLVS